MKEFLAEKWFPFEEVSIESMRERIPGMPYPPLNRLHVWFARRPLLTSRATVLLSLIQNKDEKKIFQILGLPTDVDIIKKFRDFTDGRAQGIKQSKPYNWPQSYKHVPTTDEFEWLFNELKKQHNGKIPTVIDPMAGGGSIPYESMILGLPTYANDLNPVAFLCLKATMEYPDKFREKLLPAIKEFSDEVHKKAKKELQEFFPIKEPEKLYGYYWSRTIKCKSCGLVIPMSPNWWIVKENKSTDVALKIVSSDDSDKCSFEIIENPKGKNYDPDKGTDERKNAVCPKCNYTNETGYVKKMAQEGKMGHQLCLVITKIRVSPKRSKWKFRNPTSDDLDAIQNAEAELEKKFSEFEKLGIVPKESYTKGFSDRCYVYGVRKYTDFFSSRQLLVHLTYAKKFIEVKEKWLKEKDKEFAEAVCVYGAIVFDTCLNFNNCSCRWLPKRKSLSGLMDIQAYPFKSSYFEWNQLLEGAAYEWAISKVQVCVKELVQYLPEKTSPCQISCSDAASLKLDDKSIEAVVVDPPYHDQVMYSEMANFFYVWLKRLVGDLFPGIFDPELTNNTDEAVANVSIYKDVEKPKEAANHHYHSKMKTCFTEMNRVLKDDGVLSVMFMHKKAEAWSELTQALMDSGFTFRASWCVRTEPGQKFGKMDKGVLKIMIILVCRKRQTEKIGSWKEVQKEIKQEASNIVKQHSDKGINGWELLVSAYGPTLGKFADYQIIKDSYGNTIGPEHALDIVSEVVNEFNTAEIAGTDFDTQAYINLVKNFPGMTVEEDLARVTTVFGGKKNIDDLSTKGGKGMLEKKGGKVTILTSKDRIAQGFIDTEKPETLTSMIDAIHACLYVYEQKGLGAVKDILLKTRRDAADSGFISVLRIIGSFVNLSPHKKLADEASVANNLLAALGHEPESVIKKGGRISDWKEGERIDDY